MLYRDAFGFVSKDEDNYNIMCGDFVITINNNDNVSITKSIPQSNAPIAYTVSTFEELPMNAVDGSTAFVSNNDILGGWYINLNPNITDMIEANLSFTTIDGEGDFLPMVSWYVDVIENEHTLYYINDDGDEFQAHGYFEIEGIREREYWNNYGYRFIKITLTPESEVEDWIRANARKTKSLYVRENGEWVYKNEIV